MLTPPSVRLIGQGRPYWTPVELRGCPHGTLVCAVCSGSVPDVVLRALHPAERKHAATLQGNRHREWIAGRHCLASALSRLSAARTPLLSLPSGAPAVPAGFTGSISHKGPLTVALATGMVQGIGIDVECAEDSDIKLAERVLTVAERFAIGELDERSIALLVVTHFAAKEAIYKAMSPTEQPDLDFETIEMLMPPLQSIKQDEWVAVAARVRGRECGIRTALFIDDKWVIAVASRE